MGLGPDFIFIKTALNEQNLPPKWETCNIENLFRIATSYLNTVKSIRKQNKDYKECQKKDVKDTEQSNKKVKNKMKASENKNPQLAKEKKPERENYKAQNKDRQQKILKALQNGNFTKEKFQSEVCLGCCI